MSAARHTPGPWGCVDTSNHAHDYRLTKPGGSPLPLNVTGNDHSEQRANARLIAAAPELLDALRTIAANASSVQMDPQWAVQVARNAIAKATGSQA